MANGSNQKLKLLYIMKILIEKTDEENTVTVNDLIAELDLYGISAERKSVYDDIETLRHYGLDIESRKSKTTDYYIASRTFEVPELKLLVDAVQCSKFITHKKSNELIKKIASLASAKQAQSLHRQVYVTNRTKAINESIYYNVDKLYSAISDGKKVTFRYFDFDMKKEKVYRKNGEKYTVSPYALSWDYENYYLVAFSTKYNGFTHYRVDRMTEIELSDETRDLIPNKDEFDIAQYAKKVFNMFGGEDESVRIEFDNSLVNAVIDRFGNDIFIGKADENHFFIWPKVAVSPAFFAWLAQFGTRARIIEPQSIVDQYKDVLNEILKVYEA